METRKYTLKDGIEFEKELLLYKKVIADQFGQDDELFDAFDKLQESNNSWILNGYIEQSQLVASLDTLKNALIVFVKKQDAEDNEKNQLIQELSEIFS